MSYVEDIVDLEALYGVPGRASLDKVATQLTPLYRKWIMASRLCILSTVGPEGTDGSPRGDDGPVVTEIDPHTLAMPDWRGNNRMDSLRNIVADGRVSLLFFVPGSNNVVRINGVAKVSVDTDLIGKFTDRGRAPRSVIVVKIAEIYSQCARALMRSEIWTGGEIPNLPSVGDILSEMTSGDIDGATYDAEWAPRAAKTMW